MTRRLLVPALVAAGGAMLAASASSGGPSLARPLHIPRLAEGKPCPASRVSRRIDFAHRYGTSPGLGAGPAFPVFGARDLKIAPAGNYHSREWAGQKVLWLVMARYRGPILIRGARLDGPGRVRFQEGNIPPLRLRIPLQTQAEPGTVVPKGTRYMPSATRVRGPGCYAYQIDGTSFSRIVVFRAVWGADR